jgi:hypothetical protein
MNFTIVIDNVKILVDLFGIYFLWIIMFYLSSHMHIYLCTPNGFYGFIVTPFLTQTPQCIAIRWIITNGSQNINIFWTLFAGFIIKKITIFNQPRIQVKN